ncbi:MAG: U32 family peptidase [Clostridiaceae bacterium]|nr:U32 family peptidase [Clostridiaceae bacterium]
MILKRSEERENNPDGRFMPPLPELLAPAGDRASLLAAIKNGANAVYLGASAFNARQKAANFDEDQLAQAIDLAHQHAVRVYLTLNTLIADDELAEACSLAARVYAAGIDAIIIQDAGLIRLLRQNLPDLPLYASTQMTIADAAGIAQAVRLGLRRVILARELSIEEISRLSEQASHNGLETEVFIHGALCVCLSGQCLFSSLNGGRSGNRGACAQPCRLAYRLSGAAGRTAANTTPYPWLSPHDLALFAALPALRQAGVASLKIEGRMRGEAYVGQVVSVYRDLLDAPAGSITPERLLQAQRHLLLAFNRGSSFTDRYLTGKNTPDFLSGAYTGSHGVYLGEIIALDSRQGFIRVILPADYPADQIPARGDILSVRRPNAESETASAPIGTMELRGRVITVRGFHPDVIKRLREGDPVYRMSDRLFEQQVDKADRGKTDLRLDIAQNPAGTIILTAAVVNGPQAGMKLTAEEPAQTVEPLDPERVGQQLAKTGQTPFHVLTLDVKPPIPLTISALNDLRRRLLQHLAGDIAGRCRRVPPLIPPVAAAATAAAGAPGVSLPRQPEQKNGEAKVNAYFYTLPDDPAELPCGADRYYLPILALTEANAALYSRAIAAQEPDSEVFAILPAALFGAQQEVLTPLLAALPDLGFNGICSVKSGPDIWRGFRIPTPQCSWVLDTGANIYNSSALLDACRQGAAGVCPAVELPAGRLNDLFRREYPDPAEWPTPVGFEVPIYGHLRIMTSAFCPIGQNLPGCRRCHRQTPDQTQPDPGSVYNLEDRHKKAFPLITHPRFCYSEILQHELLCNPFGLQSLQHESNQPAPFQLQARLYFHQETARECRSLISACRLALKTADEQSAPLTAGQRRQNAESFIDTAAAAARRLNRPVRQENP